MTPAPPTMLVDTCVWLDRYLRDRPHAPESAAFFAAARASGSQLLYAASKAETLFYLVSAGTKDLIRRERGELGEADALFARRYAWASVDNMRELASAASVGEGDLWTASKLRPLSPDLEDNVLMAVAQRVRADWLVTWDGRLLRTAGALVRTADPAALAVALREQVT